MEKDYGLIFSAAEIREKGCLTVSRALDPELFAGLLAAPAAVAKADIELNFTAGGGSLLLEGRIKAELSTECSRCNGVFGTAFAEAFDEAYEDAVESIDVRGLLIESVTLMMPLKPLCAEDCKGLCRVCGGDLNLKTCGCVDTQETAFEGAKRSGPFDALRNLPPAGPESGGRAEKKRGKGKERR
jgi:uncharacterized metal-binding protein YceD (DUF177 family)